MRGPLVLAALLLTATPAAAQLGAHLDLQVDAPDDPVGPEGAQVTATLMLACQTSTYMPDQFFDLDVWGPAGSRIDGPESVLFPSHVCALDPYPTQTATFRIHLPADINASSTVTYRIAAHPSDTQPPFYADGADALFMLSSPPAPPAPPAEAAPQPAVDDADVQRALETAAEEAAQQDAEVANIPGLGWVASLVGLAGAVLLRRRA